MSAETIERTEFCAPSRAGPQAPGSPAGDAAPPSIRKPGPASPPFDWLRGRVNALARYVMRQQTAAAYREIRRGKRRLWIRPNRD